MSGRAWYPATPPAAALPDALLAARLLALDPRGTGAVIRAQNGPLRERWLAFWRAHLAPATTIRKMPPMIGDDRLLGGLDLSATLAAGHEIAERGLLAESDGGVVIALMAERLSVATAARLAQALDTGAVALARDGLSRRLPARIGVLAFDEGLNEEERLPAVLGEHLAFRLDFSDIAARDMIWPRADPEAITAARRSVGAIGASEAMLGALCEIAAALGIHSLRAPLLALRAARGHAALAGKRAIDEADVTIAARLVLAPRAVQLPPQAVAEAQNPPAEKHQDASRNRAPAPGEADDGRRQEDDHARPGESESPPSAAQILAAVRAHLPPGLLAGAGGKLSRSRAGAVGRVGATRSEAKRGRPIGVSRGEPKGGKRLHVIATLRAAAPWQPLRRDAAGRGKDGGHVLVRRSDFRVIRYREPAATLTIFVVDASGSTAFERLAEAKGAVELLLGECYVRRDQVALVAFRGQGAEVLLPPTHALARARRALSALPGGGATPLAAGLDVARGLVIAAQQRGESATVVVLTDGRANVARDGAPLRARAEADARAAAAALRARGSSGVLIDTARWPHPFARELAAAMGVSFLALPQADAATLSRAARAARMGSA